MRKLCFNLGICLAILAGCQYEGTSIQRKYVDNRQDCRDEIEEMFDEQMLQSRDDRARELINNVFNRCMSEKHGWLMNTQSGKKQQR